LALFKNLISFFLLEEMLNEAPVKKYDYLSEQKVEKLFSTPKQTPPVSVNSSDEK